MTPGKTIKGTPKVVYAYQCPCGHRWTEDYGCSWDMTAYEPNEEDMVECPKCGKEYELEFEE